MHETIVAATVAVVVVPTGCVDDRPVYSLCYAQNLLVT